MGVSVGMIYYVILFPHLLSFSSYNNVIFRPDFHMFYLLFVGNKSNQASTVKRSKKGVKFQCAGHATAYRRWDDLDVVVLQMQAIN